MEDGTHQNVATKAQSVFKTLDLKLDSAMLQNEVDFELAHCHL